MTPDRLALAARNALYETIEKLVREAGKKYPDFIEDEFLADVKAALALSDEWVPVPVEVLEKARMILAAQPRRTDAGFDWAIALEVEIDKLLAIHKLQTLPAAPTTGGQSDAASEPGARVVDSEALARFPGEITIPRALLAEASRGLKRHYEMPELRREIDRLMNASPPPAPSGAPMRGPSDRVLAAGADLVDQLCDVIEGLAPGHPLVVEIKTIRANYIPARHAQTASAASSPRDGEGKA